MFSEVSPKISNQYPKAVSKIASQEVLGINPCALALPQAAPRQNCQALAGLLRPLRVCHAAALLEAIALPSRVFVKTAQELNFCACIIGSLGVYESQHQECSFVVTSRQPACGSTVASPGSRDPCGCGELVLSTKNPSGISPS